LNAVDFRNFSSFLFFSSVENVKKVAVGPEDIQIMLSIFIPVVVIIVIPLVVYFHRNGVNFERLKLQIEGICQHVHEAERDKEKLDNLNTKLEILSEFCKSQERRIALLESRVYGNRYQKEDDGR